MTTLCIFVIGVASYGTLGHVPHPSTSNCLIFQVTAQRHKLYIFSDSIAYSEKYSHYRPIALSLFTA